MIELRPTWRPERGTLKHSTHRLHVEERAHRLIAYFRYGAYRLQGTTNFRAGLAPPGFAQEQLFAKTEAEWRGKRQAATHHLADLDVPSLSEQRCSTEKLQCSTHRS